MQTSMNRINVVSAALAAGAMLSAASVSQAAPTSYQTAVQANSPYVYHRLNESPVANDTVAADTSVNSRPGVYKVGTSGTATSTPGAGLLSDNAVRFSGPGTGVTGATGAYLGNTNIRPFGSSLGTSTFEFVFKVNPGFGTIKQALFGVFDPSASPTDVEVTLNSQGNDALADAPNTTRFYIRGNDADGVGVHFTNAALYDGNYHHLVFTFDRSTLSIGGTGLGVQTFTGGFAAYVDGVPQTLTLQVVGNNSADPDALPDGFTAFDFDPTWAARNVRGSLGTTAVQRLAAVTIDETALYTSVLTPAQVAANAAAIPEPGLLSLLALTGLGLLRRARRQA